MKNMYYIGATKKHIKVISSKFERKEGDILNFEGVQITVLGNAKNEVIKFEILSYANVYLSMYLPQLRNRAKELI